MKFQITHFRFQIRRAAARGAFSLIEVLITVTLLSLIVLALMTVFSNTQSAFRASVTQTDVLEGGRNAMQMIAEDLRGMTPSGGTSNVANLAIFDSVNFFSLSDPAGSVPLVQTLPASSALRTNLLNYFFWIGRDNNKWTAVGYVVDSTATATLYPLYRYYAETNLGTPPYALFLNFSTAVNVSAWSNMSHIVDGVVHLVARPQDPKGVWINNSGLPYTNAANTLFFSSAYSETRCFMLSNTLPAAVEVQLGILEDRTLLRAEALPTYTARTNYLSQQAGHVHVFRQLVPIPNVDTSAYK